MNQPLTDKRQQSVDNKDPETEWSSIWIAAVLSFVGSVQFSLYFSALWPYLQILDFGMSETFFGATIALYSVGSLFIKLIFFCSSVKFSQVPFLDGGAIG
jgi:hypothetical protein